MKKTVQSIYSPPTAHWVGDGFPVHTLFDYHRHGSSISPFLMLDHAGPHYFAPSPHRQGVGTHPHRGFETVTLVYDGEISHRDSLGTSGTIGPGEVQWMTAGGGVMHEEFHSDTFSRTGGKLEMVQLWVNLPARHKMDAPRYQALTAANIPSVPLPERAGTVRVIAGQYGGHEGPAHTHTPINVWDVQLARGARPVLHLPDGHTLLVMVVRGTVHVHGLQVHAADLVQLSSEGTRVALEANSDARVLVLSGEPIKEPVVGQGPFVMNTREELAQAYDDFYQGRFARPAAPV